VLFNERPQLIGISRLPHDRVPGVGERGGEGLTEQRAVVGQD
jgi:hypothetical protein